MQHHRHRFTLVMAALTLCLAPAAYAAVTFPTITDVEAISAPGTAITTAPAGMEIQINGQNFGATGGTVAIAQILATVSNWSDTKIQATVPRAPAYPRQGRVSVAYKSGVAGFGPQFTITAPPPPPPSTTTTVGSWQVITFSATGTPTAITAGGALIFNGPNGALTSQPFIVPNIYAPNPAPVSLGTMTAGQNTTISAAVEGLPAADGSREIQLYGFANTGTPGETHAVQATVTVDATGKVSVKWTDLHPADAYSSEIYGASSWGAVGGITASKGQLPTPYIWPSSSPSHSRPKFGAGSEAEGPSFWAQRADPLSTLAFAWLIAVNSWGKMFGVQYALDTNGTSAKTFEYLPWKALVIALLALNGNTFAYGINDLGDIGGAASDPNDAKGLLQPGFWVCHGAAPDQWYKLDRMSALLSRYASTPQSSAVFAINNGRYALVGSPAASYGKLSLANVNNPTKPKFTDLPAALAGFGPNGATAVLSNGFAVAGVTATSNPVVVQLMGSGLPAAQATAITKTLQPILDQMNETLKTESNASPLDRVCIDALQRGTAFLTLGAGQSAAPATASAAAAGEFLSLRNLLAEEHAFSGASTSMKQQWGAAVDAAITALPLPVP